MIALLPAIRPRSAAADSTFLRSATPSPTPMLSTTLSMRGTCIGLPYLNCSVSFLRTTSSNCERRRGGPFGSGSRGFFSPLSLFAASALAFSARSALSTFSGLGALSVFSAFGAFLSSLSAIDLCSRALGEANLLLAHHLEAHARRLAVLRIGEREVGEVHRPLFGDDAAFLARALLLVALDHVDAAHDRAPFGRAHLDHLAAAALVAAGDHHDLVALADLRRHHSTSGASEMIFM